MKYLLNIATLLASVTLFAVPENNQKIQLFLKKAESHLKSNTDSCLFYTNEVIKLSEQINYPIGWAEANYLKGRLYNYEQDHTKADSLLSSAKLIYEAENDSIWLARVVNQMGTSERYKNNFDLALQKFEQAKAIAKRIGNEEIVAICNGNIGITYDYKGDYPKALEYTLKALKYFEKVGNERKIAHMHMNIAAIHYFTNDFQKALNNYNKAAEVFSRLNDKRNEAAVYKNISALNRQLFNTNEAKETLLKAKEIGESINWYAFVNGCNVDLGTIEQDEGKYLASLAYYKAALDGTKLFDKSNEELAVIYINRSYPLNDLKKYKESINSLKKALALAEKTKMPFRERHIYNQFSETYELMNQPEKALSYLKKQMAVNDSIFNETKSKQIAELELKYETEKKDKQLAIEQAELIETQCLLEEESKAKRQQLILLLSLLSIAGLAIFMFSLISRNRKLRYRVLQHEKFHLEETSSNLYQKNEALHIKNERLKKSEQAILKQNQKLNHEKEKLEQSISIKNNITPALKNLVNIKGYTMDTNLILYSCRDETKTNNALILSEADDTVSVRITNKELLNLLPNDVFTQANRAIIVNLLQVKYIANKKLVMANNDKIDISENNFKQIKTKRELLIK